MWYRRVQLKKRARASQRLSSSIACMPHMAVQGCTSDGLPTQARVDLNGCRLCRGDQLLGSSPGILLQQLGEEAVGELGGCALLVRREVKDVGQQPCGVRPSGSLRMLGGRVLSPTARRQPNGEWPNAAAVSTSAIVGSTSSGTNSSARSLRTTAGTKSMGPSSRCMNKDINSAKPWVSSFATWLEDAAIPSRVIDELMGHTGGRRDRGAGGSPMGRVYRETTPAMVAG
jgi:hypothetical protein